MNTRITSLKPDPLDCSLCRRMGLMVPCMFVGGELDALNSSLLHICALTNEAPTGCCWQVLIIGLQHFSGYSYINLWSLWSWFRFLCSDSCSSKIHGNIWEWRERKARPLGLNTSGSASKQLQLVPGARYRRISQRINARDAQKNGKRANCWRLCASSPLLWYAMAAANEGSNN